MDEARRQRAVHSLLPPALAADDRFLVLEQLASRLNELDLSRLLVYLVDTVEASALPALAEQLHIHGEGWQLTKDEAEKRRLLKRAIELHRYKGTPWAIQHVLNALSLSGRIQEWFEADYNSDGSNGAPFHFKVDIDLTTRGIDQATVQSLEALINEYKNVRSRLEALRLSLTNRSTTPVVAAAMVSGEIVTVFPYYLPSELTQQSAVPNIGIGHWSVERTTLYPQNATR
ncbi:phage tail P2-like protein [Chitinivorax tropicus]|uniref:Phage tail P2-like protein n=1 Tax=Chitinivorax tropicus TaxID=714531 RepID=A0A840MIT4_9PROT|nr:phage tail protein I [Chitinivorax tropicus]MBB5017425.1 phage tail P2-like protein [Chitinivorax tropicus]